ncbi:MAG: methyl-accepting chemotaxis protein, partial [Deltaproteobacteria bacterium]|nr:methyl-accepting chemotaxis protein [Deltaproteobacteria bacterium]
MVKIIRGSLIGKLVVIFLIVALVPIAIIGYFSFGSAQSALQEAEFDKLYSERELRESQLLDYLYNTLDAASFLARVPSVQESFSILASFRKRQLRSSGGNEIDVRSEDYNRVAAEISPSFTGFVELYGEKSGFKDILLMDQKLGFIIYSQKKGDDLGMNLKSGPLKNSGLAKMWEKILKSEKPALVDFAIYQPIGAPAAFVGVPVYGSDGDLAGVLALRLGAERIDAIMRVTQAVGATGIAYLVGEDLLVRSDSGREKVSNVLTRKVDTEATRKAIGGSEGTGIVKDEAGNTWLSSYTQIGLKRDAILGADFNWALVTEIQTSEAFGPVSSLGHRMILLSVALGLVVAVTAVFISRGIARPVISLANQVSQMSKGDLTVDVFKTRRVDEIGILASAVNRMVRSMRKQVCEILESANVVAAAATEISTTVSQLAASATSASEAVTESAATAEQVKKAAEEAGARARSVENSSKKAVEISTVGTRATEETIQKMNVIKQQMESIGGTVLKLNEHSQAIENIVSVVQDLADQSNLLAVNASIESARAGEQGKGFAVVAYEIKTLADQSKKATQQIR